MASITLSISLDTVGEALRRDKTSSRMTAAMTVHRVLSGRRAGPRAAYRWSGPSREWASGLQGRQEHRQAVTESRGHLRAGQPPRVGPQDLVDVQRVAVLHDDGDVERAKGASVLAPLE